MPSFANQFPSQGSWLFAYLDKFYDDGTTNYAGADSFFMDGVHTMEGGPAEWSLAAWEYAIKFGRTYSQSDRNVSWQGTASSAGLADYLQHWVTRNFYYFGHGASNLIGGDISKLDSSNNITGADILTKTGSKACLTSQWVKDNVTFNKSYGAIPFRFVFLDGCNTASGDWPQAWGVPKQEETIDYYKSPNNTSHARPSAFVGWDVTVGGNKDWGTIDKFPHASHSGLNIG
jgi:hypothetical protein